MSFAADLKRFRATVEARTQEIFVGTAEKALESIQVGSPITGSPGQPVDTGFLRSSWQLSFPTPTTAEIATNVSYAPVIEDGERSSYDPEGVQRPKGLPSQNGGVSGHIKSQVGGNHSVALTVAGIDKIVEQVTREVAANA